MHVAYKDGDIVFALWDELKTFIIERSHILDDIGISGDNDYPCISILLNNQYACVHYFLNDEGDMWQSIGYGNIDIGFLTNGESTVMPADAVISIDKAIQCVEQFYDTMQRPDCIEWREL